MPRACSGAMYAGVPIIIFVSLVGLSRIRATPKSVSFAFQRASTMMLLVLMSRCTTPWACAYSSARHTCSITCTARAGGNGPASRTSASVRPVKYSITM